MSGKNRLFKSGKTIRLRWNFCQSWISAGFGKSARFRLEPEPETKSGTALLISIVHTKELEFPAMNYVSNGHMCSQFSLFSIRVFVLYYI